MRHSRVDMAGGRDHILDARPTRAMRVKLLGAAHPETVRTAKALESVSRAGGKLTEAKTPET